MDPSLAITTIAARYELPLDWLGAAAEVWRKELRPVPATHLRAAVEAACQGETPPSLPAIQAQLRRVQRGEVKPLPPQPCGRCDDGYVTVVVVSAHDTTELRAACVCELGQVRPCGSWKLVIAKRSKLPQTREIRVDGQTYWRRTS